MQIASKVVLVTGGSSGIGKAFAEALAEKGAKLVLTGRRPEPLEAARASLVARGAEVAIVAGDVREAGARGEALRVALRRFGRLDILVNNAGAVRAGRLENIEPEEIEAMIAVDLVAPILMTREALPLLRAGRESLVVNVTSGIALIGVPFYTVYAAAKAGLARFSEALRRELVGEGVGVLTVYPGATDTPMMASSNAGPDLGFVKETPEAVAAAIIQAIEADAIEVIRGGEARAAMIALNRDDPQALDERFGTMKTRLEAAVRDHRAL